MSKTVDCTPTRVTPKKKERSQKIIYQGLLDYDEQFLALPKHLKASVPIQVIYPNRAFQIEQSKAVESQQSLRDEAEEHYQLLKNLSQVDQEY